MSFRIEFAPSLGGGGGREEMKGREVNQTHVRLATLHWGKGFFRLSTYNERTLGNVKGNGGCEQTPKRRKPYANNNEPVELLVSERLPDGGGESLEMPTIKALKNLPPPDLVNVGALSRRIRRPDDTRGLRLARKTAGGCGRSREVGRGGNENESAGSKEKVGSGEREGRESASSSFPAVGPRKAVVVGTAATRLQRALGRKGALRGKTGNVPPAVHALHVTPEEPSKPRSSLARAFPEPRPRFPRLQGPVAPTSGLSKRSISGLARKRRFPPAPEPPASNVAHIRSPLPRVRTTASHVSWPLSVRGPLECPAVGVDVLN
ncbi:hypothetical protein HPB51_015277 [Rhipicephalus microplus]|uniref:Uncharacterized protein n=1 Tax=Rhipicephalus microplus TaxID=6941 RepID=A0A9J6DV72_RHIMP|nr:hypothetical protein HPB51_015277 [Rhipicephalus microplus]